MEDQEDTATEDVPADSPPTGEDAAGKITSVVDEAKSQLAGLSISAEDAAKAGADIDKMGEAAKLKIASLVEAAAEAASEPEKSKLEALADKKIFGISVLWLIGAAVAAVIVFIIVIIATSRKRPEDEDLGDFSLDPTSGLGSAKEFEFGNGTAICQTSPSPGEAVVAQLVFGDGGKYGVFSISKAAVRIGRGGDNDLIFKNDSVSRHHAEILCKRDGKFVITDLDSGNGVLVNGRAVAQQELHSGDSIEVGEVCFTFSKQS